MIRSKISRDFTAYVRVKFKDIVFFVLNILFAIRKVTKGKN